MSPTRYQGRHRRPRRRPGSHRLVRGGLLTGVAGTVAMTGTTSHASAAAEGRASTTAELTALPTLDTLVADSASRAAAATEDYATDAATRQAVEAAEQEAIDKAQREAAELREREERRAAAAAEAEARAAAAEAAQTQQAAPETPTTLAAGANDVVSFALAQLGDGYRLGSTGPDAWDCSSLVQAAYASVGVSLPRTAAEQSVAGTQVSLDALVPGDILYWGGAGSAYHVAIYVGDGTFVGAQNSATGVVQQTLDWDPPTGAVRVM